MYPFFGHFAKVVKLVDTLVSEASGRESLGVQVPLFARYPPQSLSFNRENH